MQKWVVGGILVLAAGAGTLSFIYAYPYLARSPSLLVVEQKPRTVASSSQPVSILFVGDIMLDRAVAQSAKRNGDASLFSDVETIFHSVDAVVANHEGTVTNEQSVSIPNPSLLQFTFDPHFAAFLKQLGITAVSLSNNHTFDFGQSGYEQTKEYLHQAGILTFGSPHNNDEPYASFAVRGTTVCLVGYEEFVNADPAPLADMIQLIRPGCDMVVATMHAGVEYNQGFTQHQQAVAHAFIDAGADVIIGTHPHVVEPLEIYKGKAIFYSLGNCMFDQDFSYETMHGLAIEMQWSGAETTYTLIPVTIQNEQVSRSGEEDSARTLSWLISTSTGSSALASEITTASSFTLR